MTDFTGGAEWLRAPAWFRYATLVGRGLSARNQTLKSNFVGAGGVVIGRQALTRTMYVVDCRHDEIDRTTAFFNLNELSVGFRKLNWVINVRETN